MAYYNGVSLSVTYFAIFALTLVWSPKNAFLTRLVVAVAMAVLLYNFSANQVMNIHSPSQRAPLLTMLWVSYMSAAEMLLLSRVDAVDLSDLSRNKSSGLSPGAASLSWNALCLYFNLRRSGTRLSVRNIPKREPQSTIRFVITTTLLWIAGYLVMNLIDLGPLPELHLVAEKKQTLWRLWELSAEDVVFRLVSCVTFWPVTLLLIWLSYYAGALVTILLGISSSAAWPPVFGPIRSASTLAGFWGTFWHQSLRAPLVGWADVILNGLGVAPRTPSRRYTRIFLVFIMSGMLHHLTDVAIGMGHRQFAATTFFSLQPLGIVAETLVQASAESFSIPAKARRFIGFCWVLVFFWWSTPVLFYPAARLGWVGKISPYSLIS